MNLRLLSRVSLVRISVSLISRQHTEARPAAVLAAAQTRLLSQPTKFQRYRALVLVVAMSRRKENETRHEENEGNINHKGTVLVVVKVETQNTHDAAWVGTLHINLMPYHQQ